MCLLIEFLGFTSRINSKGYHSLVSCIISIFLETVWVPLIYIISNSNYYLNVIFIVFSFFFLLIRLLSAMKRDLGLITDRPF